MDENENKNGKLIFKFGICIIVLIIISILAILVL